MIKKFRLFLIFLLCLFGFGFINCVDAATNISECGNVSSTGVYELNQSLTLSDGQCLLINASNVILDCKGYSITGLDLGSPGVGIQGEDMLDNVTVQNCNISGFAFAVDATDVNNSYFLNNIFYNGSVGGIYLGTLGDASMNLNVLFNNTITLFEENATAIFLDTNVTNINISGNTLTTSGDDGTGIYLVQSNNAIIHNNNITSSGQEADAIWTISSLNASITSNLITTLASSSEGIYASECESFTIYNNTIKTTEEYAIGIYLDSSSFSNLTNNIFNTTNAYAIWVDDGDSIDSFNHTVGGNTEQGELIYYFFNNNSGVLENKNVGQVFAAYSNNMTFNNLSLNKDGILFVSTHNSTVKGCNLSISYAEGHGFYSFRSNSTIIYNNTITLDEAIGLGVYIHSDSNNTNITSNKITLSGLLVYGIYLTDYITHSTIYDNTIVASGLLGYGITTSSSSNNSMNSNNITTNVLAGVGIYLFNNSDSNTLNQNTLAGSGEGSIGILTYYNSDYTNVSLNTVTLTGNDSFGIYISEAEHLDVQNNVLNVTNGLAVYLSANSTSQCNHTIENNTEQGTSVLYSFNNNSIKIENQSFAQLIVANSDNVTLNNLTIDKDGITFIYTENSTIKNSNITTSETGIWTFGTFNSHYNNITDNNFTILDGAGSYGIYTELSNSSTFTRNKLWFGSSSYTVYSISSENNLLYDNIFNISATSSYYFDNSPNSWNTAKTSGTNIMGRNYLAGNFWTNPSETGYSDTCSDTNEDYICDNRYRLATDNFDYLPLAKTYTAASADTSCFPAGTKILMVDGNYKNVEEVSVGDFVISYDERTRSQSSSEVLELESPVRDHMCEISFDNSNLKLTNEHPIYTSNGWKSILPEETQKENAMLVVGKLRVGDKVLFSNSNYQTVKDINCWKETVQTYNLKSVDKNNFYAQDVLVHNKGDGVITGFWLATYVVSDEQLESGYTKELSERYRLKFTVDGGVHYAGIVELTSTAAKINISSTPQQVTFGIGQEKKFDVTNDSYYDLYLKLDSIVDGKANVILGGLHEPIPASTDEQQQQEEETGDELNEQGDAQGYDETKGSWAWLGVIILLAIIGTVLYLWKKRKVRNYR